MDDPSNLKEYTQRCTIDTIAWLRSLVHAFDRRLFVTDRSWFLFSTIRGSDVSSYRRKLRARVERESLDHSLIRIDSLGTSIWNRFHDDPMNKRTGLARWCASTWKPTMQIEERWFSLSFDFFFSLTFFFFFFFFVAKEWWECTMKRKRKIISTDDEAQNTRRDTCSFSTLVVFNLFEVRKHFWLYEEFAEHQN